jgi:hypothetical protein
MSKRIGTVAASIRDRCTICLLKKYCVFLNVREPVKKRIYICHDCIVDYVLKGKADEPRHEDGVLLPDMLVSTPVGVPGADDDDEGDRAEVSRATTKKPNRSKKRTRTNKAGVK